MTGPEDSHSNTRPISVAELLAKNGTIGAPPVGGRRRRRRGNSDAVTVAELTGEIPVVSPDGDHDTAEGSTDRELADEEGADVTEPVSTNSTAEPELDSDSAQAEADYAAHLDARAADPDPLEFQPFGRPPRSAASAPRRGYQEEPGGAEEMSPDPFVDDDDLDSDLDDDDATTAAQSIDADELPSYLRSRDDDSLFGGPTVTGLPRRAALPGPDDLDHEEEDSADRDASESTMARVLRGAGVVGQCVVAVAFGAGLFVAFDQLWKWNLIIALVLTVLVILGLVVGVRVVRKTEDIGSTMIAVAVGLLVCLGPLALLHSG